MKNTKISIIITCYNLGVYLEDAIFSIIAYNAYEDLEIILVNDGSTDELTNIALQKISVLYPFVFILNQHNQGLAKARNNGIKLAKGKYIIPLDADNKLRPEFIQKTIEILDTEENIDVVFGNAQFFGNKNTLWKVKPFNISEMVLNNYIDACAGYRKSLWETLGGYDENMPIMGFEDWDLWLRMSTNGAQFKYVDEVFFDYRVRNNSMLSEAWEKRPVLLDYIFNKPELNQLKVLRKCLIENQQLKQEPSIKQIIKLIMNKCKRKLKF